MSDGNMKLYSYFITILEFVHIVFSIRISFINLLHKYTPKSRITKDKFNRKQIQKVIPDSGTEAGGMYFSFLHNKGQTT